MSSELVRNEGLKSQSQRHLARCLQKDRSDDIFTVGRDKGEQEDHHQLRHGQRKDNLDEYPEIALSVYLCRFIQFDRNTVDIGFQQPDIEGASAGKYQDQGKVVIYQPELIYQDIVSGNSHAVGEDLQDQKRHQSVFSPGKTHPGKSVSCKRCDDQLDNRNYQAQFQGIPYPEHKIRLGKKLCIMLKTQFFREQRRKEEAVANRKRGHHDP